MMNGSHILFYKSPVLFDEDYSFMDFDSVTVSRFVNVLNYLIINILIYVYDGKFTFKLIYIGNTNRSAASIVSRALL